jgi:3-hydroxyisobutyrate dehydrogenase-like beta-hydroxyacid dehydrogenase
VASLGGAGEVLVLVEGDEVAHGYEQVHRTAILPEREVVHTGDSGSGETTKAITHLIHLNNYFQ